MSQLITRGVTLFLPEFPGLVISAIVVDWFGRKATMWILLFGCCAFLGPLAVHQKESLATALLFGARACGMGSSTVLCLYAPEVCMGFQSYDTVNLLSWSFCYSLHK